MIKTNRLQIYPATKEQMQTCILNEKNDDLKYAYIEMYENAQKHLDKWEWYSMWIIELTDSTHIGDLCFKGLNKEGISEIGYGILAEYQNKGYATEAVKAILNWAFSQSNVNSIEAEADIQNIASIKILNKCGFKPNGIIGEEGPRFSLTRHDFQQN